MPLCTCGHEQHEHPISGEGTIHFSSTCSRCECGQFYPRPNYAATTSFADLPVSQGARDLWEKVKYPAAETAPGAARATLDVLAAADEKDVRNLLWARRTGKL